MIKCQTEEGSKIKLIRCKDGIEESLGEIGCPEGKVELTLVLKKQKSAWFVITEKGEKICVAENIDMTGLSTESTGGFTGCTFGMYASSNGLQNGNYADFYMFGCEEL